MARRDNVILYRGFGSRGRVYVHGRALQDRAIKAADVGHGRLRNLHSMLLRADANPLPQAAVRISIGASRHELTADDEGFFSGEIPATDARRLDAEWIAVEAEV